MFLLSTFPFTVSKSSKTVSGVVDTIRSTCKTGPPTFYENKKRVEFGDKVIVKLSAYS